MNSGTHIQMCSRMALRKLAGKVKIGQSFCARSACVLKQFGNRQNLAARQHPHTGRQSLCQGVLKHRFVRVQRPRNPESCAADSVSCSQSCFKDKRNSKHVFELQALKLYARLVCWHSLLLKLIREDDEQTEGSHSQPGWMEEGLSQARGVAGQQHALAWVTPGSPRRGFHGQVRSVQSIATS